MPTTRKSNTESSPKDRDTEVERALAKNPGFSRFDAADHLDTDEVIAAYRDAAGETGDPALLARAEATIARALDALHGYVVLQHDGHQAIVHFDMADRIFVGRIVAMNDDIGFHGTTVAEVKAAFREAVTNYRDVLPKRDADLL